MHLCVSILAFSIAVRDANVCHEKNALWFYYKAVHRHSESPPSSTFETMVSSHSINASAEAGSISRFLTRLRLAVSTTAQLYILESLTVSKYCREVINTNSLCRERRQRSPWMLSN